MQPASVSSNESGTALIFINKLLNIFGISLTEFIVRKMAHFTEFTVLGILLYLNINHYFNKVMTKLNIIVSVLFCGLLCAMIDESIQMFSPGRSCEVKDVWIDFSGVILGTLICALVHKFHLFRRFFKHDLV